MITQNYTVINTDTYTGHMPACPSPSYWSHFLLCNVCITLLYTVTQCVHHTAVHCHTVSALHCCTQSHSVCITLLNTVTQLVHYTAVHSHTVCALHCCTQSHSVCITLLYTVTQCVHHTAVHSHTVCASHSCTQSHRGNPQWRCIASTKSNKSCFFWEILWNVPDNNNRPAWRSAQHCIYPVSSTAFQPCIGVYIACFSR